MEKKKLHLQIDTNIEENESDASQEFQDQDNSFEKKI
jgi:hypothetical protein